MLDSHAQISPVKYHDSRDSTQLEILSVYFAIYLRFKHEFCIIYSTAVFEFMPDFSLAMFVSIILLVEHSRDSD